MSFVKSIEKIAPDPYVFLSYSHADDGIVRQLAAFLAQEELPAWLDNHLEFGDSWEETIAHRIRGCAVVYGGDER